MFQRKRLLLKLLTLKEFRSCFLWKSTELYLGNPWEKLTSVNHADGYTYLPGNHNKNGGAKCQQR